MSGPHGAHHLLTPLPPGVPQDSSASPSPPWVSREGTELRPVTGETWGEAKGMRRAEDPPHLEAGERILHRALVELDHVGVHVSVVAADVPLRAAIGHRAEAEGRVLVLRPLKLRAEGSAVCDPPPSLPASPPPRPPPTVCTCTVRKQNGLSFRPGHSCVKMGKLRPGQGETYLRPLIHWSWPICPLLPAPASPAPSCSSLQFKFH